MVPIDPLRAMKTLRTLLRKELPVTAASSLRPRADCSGIFPEGKVLNGTPEVLRTRKDSV
jgi:hypothetical protein